MALVLKIGQNGGSDYNLSTGDLAVRDGGWTCAATDTGWMDTFLLVSRATAANIRTAMRSLEMWRETARRYMATRFEGGASIAVNPVWLYANSDGETARRALVRSILIQYQADLGGPLQQRPGASVIVVVERGPWEDTTLAAADTDPTDISVLGGTTRLQDYTSASPVGDLDARIEQIFFQNDGAAIYRLWAGIVATTSDKTNYKARWDLSAGSAGIDSAASADTNTTTGSSIISTFATTASLVERVNITATQAVTGGDAATWRKYLIGRHAVLLRCKTDAGTVGARVFVGTSTSAAVPVGDEVYVTTTSYRLIPMGECVLPPWADRGLVSTDMTAIAFYVKAEIITGSPTQFAMDCIGLVPAERMVQASGLVTTANTGADSRGNNYISVAPDDSTAVIGIDTGGATKQIQDSSVRNWYWPASLEGACNPGVLVLFGERETSSSVGDTMDGFGKIYRRWNSYHG